MSELIRGEGVIIKFLKGDEYLPYGCARSITLNLTADFIGKSTTGSGNWKEKEIVALDWNFTLEGIGYYDIDTQFLISDVYRQWFDMTPIEIEFFVTGENGTTIIMGGTALITGVTTNGAVNNLSSLNVTGEGTGELWSSTSFRIILVEADDPSPGLTTLTFDFDEVPGSTGYTIRVRDLTDGTEVNNTGGVPPREVPSLDSTHQYAFALRPEPDGEFGSEIFWPDDPTEGIIIDSDGQVIIDADGEEITDLI